MQLPTRFEFDALVLSSQIPSDDPHHLLERSHLVAIAKLHCYPDDSEIFQGKAKFTCGNEEQVILIPSTHPLFDISHHFVFHPQQGGQDTVNNPTPDSNPPPDSNPEDAYEDTGGTNDGSHHRGAFDDMPLSKEKSLPPRDIELLPLTIKTKGSP